MSTSLLVDRVKINILSAGTGAFSLGGAVPSFRGVEALVNGATYSYAVEQDANFEVGTGVYFSAGNQFVRSPQLSSNGGATVAFQANAQLVFTALAADMSAGAFPIVDALGTSPTLAISQRAATQGIDDAIAAATAMLSVSIQSSQAIAAGDFVNVYVSGGSALVRKAIASSLNYPAHGFCLDAIANGASGLVSFGGINSAVSTTGMSGQAWLSDTAAGDYDTTPPSTAGSYVQMLGSVVPGVGVSFFPQPSVLLS